MVGLLRSFTVNIFDPDDAPGRTMCKMANQTGTATEIVVADLLEELADIRDQHPDRVGGGSRPDRGTAGKSGTAV